MGIKENPAIKKEYLLYEKVKILFSFVIYPAVENRRYLFFGIYTRLEICCFIGPHISNFCKQASRSLISRLF